MRRLVPQLASLLLVLLAAPGVPAQAPSEQQTKELLAAIDKAFDAGDLKTLLGHFRPSHKTLAAQFEARMKAALGFGARLHRNSEIVHCKNRHGRAVALVRATTSCVVQPNLQHAEHCYLVASTTAAGPKADFMVTVNDHVLRSMQRDRFTCPACNYTFGGNSSWLAVPAWPDETGCMESLTFIALGHDLVVEVSVHVLEEALPAPKAMTELLESMKDLPWAKVTQHTEVRPWLPPAYAEGKAPSHLDGARCQVPLQDGDTADIHLATFGPIRYLMVVQGEQALLESQEVAITDLLKGFKLLDSKKAPAAICQLAMQAHTGGGKIAGNTYSHPLHNLKVTAPEGWSGSAFASRHLFRVRFQCPAGTSNLLLQAMAPPVGYTTWTEERANQLFLRSCANQQLETTTDTSWTRDPQGFRWREARSRDDQTPAILRLARRGPVLVMMTAEARDQATLAEIRKAIGSLALVK